MSSRVGTSKLLPSAGEIKSQFGVIDGLGSNRRGVLSAEQAREYRQALHRGDPDECSRVIAELATLLDKSPGRNWRGGTHATRVRQRRYYPLAHADAILPVPNLLG